VRALALLIALGAGWPTLGHGGATIQLPPAFRDLTGKARLVPATTSLAARHPRLEPYLIALSRDVGPAFKLVAADTTAASLAHGFLTTVYVKFEPTFDNSKWQAQVLAQTKVQANVSRLTARWLSLAAGRALELRYRWRLYLGADVYDIAVTQFEVLAPKAAVTISYWTTPAQDAAYRPIFEQSAATLRVNPA
jgi:hypothetical protein